MVRYARFQIEGGLRKNPKPKRTEEQDVEEESEAQLAAQAETIPSFKRKKVTSKVLQFSLKGLDEYNEDNCCTPPSCSASTIAAELHKKTMDAGKVKKSKKKKIHVSGEFEQELRQFKKENQGKMTTDEENELETYIKKEKRREERRVKRADERLSSKVCFNCREAGHTIADCPKMTKSTSSSLIEEHGTGICFKCGSTEHKVDKCRVKLPPGEYPYATCFICNEKGHLSSQCVDNPRGLYPSGGCCGLCGSVEHYKKDCPEQQKAKGIPDMKLKTIMMGGSVDDDLLDVRRPPVAKRKGPKIVKF